MNWYRPIKTASITFRIDGTENIAKPMSILDISQDMERYFYGKIKNTHMEFVSPDTSRSQYYATTGFINFYIFPDMEVNGKRLTPQIASGLVSLYNHSKSPFIKINVEGQDISNLRKIPTLRLNVVENHTTDFDDPPYMNVTSRSAEALLMALATLGVDTSKGYIDADELATAIKSPDQIRRMMAIPPSEHGEKAKLIDQGIGEWQVAKYLHILQEMVNYIQKADLPNKRIVWI